MHEISKSVKKADHDIKIQGSAKYCCDFYGDDVLNGKFVRSTVARGKVLNVAVPELPEGYYYVDAKDVPGDNNVNIIKDDTPVFCRETVEYIGEPIGMICGPDLKVVEKLVKETKVDYELLEPVFDVMKAEEIFFEYEYGKGDLEKAFAEADKVYEEEFITGRQDQAYLETQSMMAEYLDNGVILVHGSIQCVYYVHGAIARAMGVDPKMVNIRQDATGGGFGGKEAFPSILGCQVAVACHATGHPVKYIFDRREDLEFSSKRHPSVNRYRAAVKDGKVTAMDCEVRFNSGAYTTLSPVVLQRGLICANGVYNVENLHVHGTSRKTNTNPCGAYRGFGAPQTLFSVESFMNHIAYDLGVDPLEFKKANLCKQGDISSTSGKYHFPVPLPQMLDEVDKAADFSKKYAEYSKPQTGRYRRGIGISMQFHGCGFTGAAERDTIKAHVDLHKFPDGTVKCLGSNADIGQGLRTTFPKIVAHELGLPLEKVTYDFPNTGIVPDSGPTVGSRSLMIVGEIFRRAAIKLKEKWVDGEEQWASDDYKEADFMIPFDLEKFQGDAYPTYSWGVNCIEVELDTLTGFSKVIGAYGDFDIGTPIDYNICKGQMEGGFLQGLGYAWTESIDQDNAGRIRNNSFADYIIPTSTDVPNFNIILHDSGDIFPYSAYGAKGAGELPLDCVSAAYTQAVEQALGGKEINYIPFRAEDTLAKL